MEMDETIIYQNEEDDNQKFNQMNYDEQHSQENQELQNEFQQPQHSNSIYQKTFSFSLCEVSIIILIFGLLEQFGAIKV